MSRWSHPGRRLRRLMPAMVLLTFCVALSCCRKPAPAIAILNVPHQHEGGSDLLEAIAGKVTGQRPGQQIVLYARADVWWVQPTRALPYTAIQPDGSWSSTTHLGSEYAALLVDKDYSPLSVLQDLPQTGGSVYAVAQVRGQRAEPVPPVAGTSTPVIHFSGYDWEVRTKDGNRGGLLHPFSTANVRVDPDGALHMRVTRRANKWVCSEVSLTRSLGYGKYLFQVRDVSALEPADDLEMFTWTPKALNPDHNEMDVILTRRGDPESKNAEYVLQPYYIPSNVIRFQVPSGRMTYSFDWEPESIGFRTVRGEATPVVTNPLSDHTFISGIPLPKDETAHINLCVFGFSRYPPQHDAEVVIERFQYLP